MDMEIKNILQKSYFKLSIHLIIWLFVATNIFYHVQNWTITKKNFHSQQILEQILQENQSFLDKDDYYHSNLYKIKSYKEEGFQLKGEIVVNPMVKEELWAGENGQFIPDIATREMTNLEKWQSCFWGGLSLPKNQENLEISLNSPCKVD